METLEQLKARIYGFQYHSIFMDPDGLFRTNSRLGHKVDASGAFKGYMGNTTVFSLDMEDMQHKGIREHLLHMQGILYGQCQDLLARPLEADTFHMTVHDLVNGRPEHVAEEDLRLVREKVKPFIEKACKEPWTVRLKTTCVFNMVNTSIVLGLEPCSEMDCRRLMELYEGLEKIVPVGYQMTPHITLAYYKPGVYNEKEIERLKAAFHILSGETFVIEFTSECLSYQEFYDMNYYVQL